MCRRKAEVGVILLQGLTALQNVPHSRFAAVRGFSAELLGGCDSEPFDEVSHSAFEPEDRERRARGDDGRAGYPRF